jgi:hypothetical protein
VFSYVGMKHVLTQAPQDGVRPKPNNSDELSSPNINMYTNVLGDWYHWYCRVNKIIRKYEQEKSCDRVCVYF